MHWQIATVPNQVFNYLKITIRDLAVPGNPPNMSRYHDFAGKRNHTTLSLNALRYTTVCVLEIIRFGTHGDWNG